MIDSSVIYQVLEDVGGQNWKKFVRNQLRLTELEIEECQQNDPRDLKEQRYQMVQMWIRKNGRRATASKLRELADPLSSESNSQPQPEATHSQYSESPSASNTAYSGSGKAVSTPVTDMAEPFSGMGGANGKIVEHPQKTVKSERTTSSRDKHSPKQKIKEDRSQQSRKNGSPKNKSTAARDVVPIKTFGNNETNEKKERRRMESGNSESPSTSSSEWSGSSELGKRGSDKKKFKLKKWLKKLAPSKGTKTGQQAVSGNFCDSVGTVYVEPMTQEDYAEIKKHSNRYPTKENRGCVLILNNEFKDDAELIRHGSHIDVCNMRELWTQMGCEIHKRDAQCEKTAEEMKNLLKEMTRLRKEYSYLVIVVMTHGELRNGDIVFKGVDNGSVSVPEIETMFNNENAPQLRNIPKLFIFQFCCGSIIDRGVQTDIARSFKRMMSRDLEDSVPKSAVRTDGGRIPTTSDMMIAYATHKYNAALRSPYYGSWFITAITNVFMRYARCENVTSMFTRVNDAMKRKEGQSEEVIDGKSTWVDVKSMSREERSFTKQLFLLPGYPR